MVETSIPLPTSRSYPLSVESASHRRRIFTIARAFLAVGYAIFALCGRHRPLTLGNAPTHEAPIKGLSAAGRIAIIVDLVRMQAASLVQQPCSNPSKCTDMLGKASKRKYSCLQVFCKLQKPPANYRAAFTRQRSLVRTQHRPLPFP
jgi:hypothetical protein